MKDPKEIKVIIEKTTYEVPTYRVSDLGLVDDEPMLIKLCKGNMADPAVYRQEGLFTETLLAVALLYLQENNVGELSNRDTSIAITHIEDALLRLQKRSDDRKKRGVQATYNK